MYQESRLSYAVFMHINACMDELLLQLIVALMRKNLSQFLQRYFAVLTIKHHAKFHSFDRYVLYDQFL